MAQTAAILTSSLALGACAPKVTVAVPTEPITINLNIKHEIYIKVDRDVEDLFADNEDLFGEN